MKRDDLLRAVFELNSRFGLDYCYVIGALILGSLPDAPEALIVHSRDIDAIPNPPDSVSAQAMRDRIDFVLGEDSDFDNEIGCFLQGVAFETPTYAPVNWTDRVTISPFQSAESLKHRKIVWQLHCS